MAQVRPEQLQHALARRLPAIVWIHGDEPLLSQEAADLTRRHLRSKGFSERRVFEVDRQFKPQALIADAQELSLFAERKLIELRSATKPGKELGQALADLLPALPDEVRLMAITPRLDRATQETAWFKAVEGHACVVPVYPVERASLPQWIGERLARQSQQADAATLALIADRVEGNLLAAYQEVQKLALLCPAGKLDPEAVRAAVLDVARYDPADLVSAMFTGDGARALRCLEGLRAEGEAEPLVLWTLSDAIRTLARLVQGVQDGRATAQLMRELRVYPPRDRLFEQALRLARPAQLTARLTYGLQQAANADRIIKGLQRGDAWQALHDIVAGVATGATLAAPPEPGDPLGAGVPAV